MLKTIVIRAIFLPILLAFACLLAGLYGVLHNQVSYRISPGYFHEFKFIQFYTPSYLEDWLGAAVIGWKASWWMGLIIGTPIYLLCLFVRGNAAFIGTFMLAAISVIASALLVGIAALIYAYLSYSPDHLPIWMEGREVADPVAFARAGTMHNAAYLGGLIGMVIGCGVAISRAIRSRRTAP